MELKLFSNYPWDWQKDGTPQTAAGWVTVAWVNKEIFGIVQERRLTMSSTENNLLVSKDAL